MALAALVLLFLFSAAPSADAMAGSAWLRSGDAVGLLSQDAGQRAALLASLPQHGWPALRRTLEHDGHAAFAPGSGRLVFACGHYHADSPGYGRGSGAAVSPKRRRRLAAAPPPSVPPELDPATAFARHSRPGAAQTILLDFTGGCGWVRRHRVAQLFQGAKGATPCTAWCSLLRPKADLGTTPSSNPHTHTHSRKGHTTNDAAWSPAEIATPPYDMDNDTRTFSRDERLAVVAAWRAVAEDFAPFDVDVTTDEAGAGATNPALRVVIGGRGEWLNATAGAGVSGAAVAGSYGAAGATAFVFSGLGSMDHPKLVAEAASHYIGHAMVRPALSGVVGSLAGRRAHQAGCLLVSSHSKPPFKHYTQPPKRTHAHTNTHRACCTRASPRRSARSSPARGSGRRSWGARSTAT